MPLQSFNCPDKETRLTADCLVCCDNPAGRCLSLPTLQAIVKGAERTGKPSTIQLLNPTRMECLIYKRDYAIDPFKMAFLLQEEISSGAEALQLLERIGRTDDFRLVGYKTFGSYAVKKHVTLDVKDEYDRTILALEMNNYRLLAASRGFNIKEVQCQITVRDGGIQSAFKNGISFNLLMVKIPIISDAKIEEYFNTRTKILINALGKDDLPELCDIRERWNGRRCKGYCDIARYCPEGAKINNIDFEG